MQAKQILNKFYPKSFDPSNKVEGKITDEKELTKIVSIVIKNNDEAVGDYKNGDAKAFNYLMGEVMKETQKRADFNVARKILEKLLK